MYPPWRDDMVFLKRSRMSLSHLARAQREVGGIHRRFTSSEPLGLSAPWLLIEAPSRTLREEKKGAYCRQTLTVTFSRWPRLISHEEDIVGGLLALRPGNPMPGWHAMPFPRTPAAMRTDPLPRRESSRAFLWNGSRRLLPVKAQAAVKSSFTLDRNCSPRQPDWCRMRTRTTQAIRKLDGVSVHMLRFGMRASDDGEVDPSAPPITCADGSTWSPPPTAVAPCATTQQTSGW